MPSLSARELYHRYADGVAYVAVRKPNGDEGIGTAFHVGEGVFLTARHVVEECEILEVGPGFRDTPSSPTVTRGPFFHPDERVDVAAFVAPARAESPAVPLGSALDDFLSDSAFLLTEVVVLGYPPVPQSIRPTLVATRAEVNAIIDKYTGRIPHVVVSAMARGGFSGAPCLIEYDFAMGMVTEALVSNDAALETGFMSVMTVGPLYECLAYHQILPAAQNEIWAEGFWERIAEELRNPRPPNIEDGGDPPF